MSRFSKRQTESVFEAEKLRSKGLVTKQDRQQNELSRAAVATKTSRKMSSI